MSNTATEMFNEVHKVNGVDGTELVFLNSYKVRAFPCGRRRATEEGTIEDYIPFDPEARLNTESNNRKHSSLNGYTQTYIDRITKNEFVISIAGYLFIIDGFTSDKIENDSDVINYIGSTINSLLSNNTGKIYANIRLEDIALFSSTDHGLSYTTEILRSQSTSAVNNCAMDILVSTDTADTSKDYYFSGLSFSSTALAADESGKKSGFVYEKEETNNLSVSITNITDGTTKQRVISLCILEYDSDNKTWSVCQQALLPKVVHGSDENSVNIDILNTKKVVLVDDNYNNIGIMPSLTVEDLGNNTYQLKFKF